MAAKDDKSKAEKSPEKPRWQTQLAANLAQYRIPLMIGTIVVFIGGAIGLWRKFGGEIESQHSEKFLVARDGLQVTPQPTWIPADVCSEVYQDAGWEQKRPSILEPDLTVRVAQAFEQHTWVAKVTRVTKHHPARVVVELQYRRPVAMVEVDYQGKSGLLPVDNLGVLLPPEDFKAEAALKFPRITVDYNGPEGSVGTPWGDARVAGGAAIAGLLIDEWENLGLYRVVALARAGGTSSDAPQYELHTRSGSRVLWGHAPEAETSGEASALQKCRQLAAYVQQNGSLAAIEKPVVIDVRQEQELSVRPEDSTRR
jgi:hypothetical protein